VRDGDPAALAGLCEVRGPAVLAYCRNVAGDAAAPAAAADAFGSFRAAVYSAQDPADINPEALLVNATRHAAARHAAIVAEGLCAEVPQLLAGRADRSITLADLDRLEEHLQACWTCRAPIERFKAAERAYRDPPATPVPPEAAAVIIAALASAAPVRADEPPAPAPAPAPEPAGAPPALNGSGHVDAPTTEFRPLGDIGLDAPAPEPEADADAAAPPRPARARLARRPKAIVTPVTVTQLPRPQRGGAASRRPRVAGPPALGPPGVMRPSVLLPVLLVATAVLVALFVSGVFGADAPTPTSGSNVAPSAVPPAATTKKPEIVVVPGARDASGAAVERAKSRARNGGRDAKPAKRTPAAAAAPPPPPPPPAAVAAPTPAATPAPTTPPKRSSNGTGGRAGINSKNGATGAEQLPPAQDTSTVPDLTPPPDPVLDPHG
jgi:hypothetical protein